MFGALYEDIQQLLQETTPIDMNAQLPAEPALEGKYTYYVEICKFVRAACPHQLPYDVSHYVKRLNKRQHLSDKYKTFCKDLILTYPVKHDEDTDDKFSQGYYEAHEQLLFKFS